MSTQQLLKKCRAWKHTVQWHYFHFSSSCYQFVALNIEVKTPATAVLLLNSSEQDIVVKACNGIRTFAEKGAACSNKESFLITHFIRLVFWYVIKSIRIMVLFSMVHHGGCFILLSCPCCKAITECICWVLGFWVLCASSSLTAMSWSDVRL